MDLLFKRYANPFLLFDNLIRAHRFCDFIQTFIDQKNEEDIYDIWLHKIHNKSLSDFRKGVIDEVKSQRQASHQNVGNTIKTSQEILNNFHPYQGGENE